MNYEQLNNNIVSLSGEIVNDPKYSHEMFNEGFYEFNLKVMRLSDAFDIIPVTVSERLLQEYDLKKGKMMSGKGQFRSFNKMEDEKSRLMLTMFIREIEPYDPNKNPNQIDIVGYVCKDPVFRTTPFKREICDVLLAVNRNYNKSDYLPCIAWGRNARFVKNLNVGDKIVASGRIQSREYEKKLENGEVQKRTAYEVSLAKVSTVSYEYMPSFDSPKSYMVK